MKAILTIARMRIIQSFALLSIGIFGYGQEEEKITTMDFVQILNDNREEALYYYQNNWKVLRNMAIKKGYIHSFQLLEAHYSETEPFQLILSTTYLNEEQYWQREANFAELIKEQGPLKLMNDKEPGTFRKSLFSKEGIRHWK